MRMRMMTECCGVGPTPTPKDWGEMLGACIILLCPAYETCGWIADDDLSPEFAQGPNQSLVSKVNTCLGGSHSFTRGSLLSIAT